MAVPSALLSVDACYRERSQRIHRFGMPREGPTNSFPPRVVFWQECVPPDSAMTSERIVTGFPARSTMVTRSWLCHCWDKGLRRRSLDRDGGDPVLPALIVSCVETPFIGIATYSPVPLERQPFAWGEIYYIPGNINCSSYMPIAW